MSPHKNGQIWLVLELKRALNGPMIRLGLEPMTPKLKVCQGTSGITNLSRAGVVCFGLLFIRKKHF